MAALLPVLSRRMSSGSLNGHSLAASLDGTTQEKSISISLYSAKHS